MSYAQSTLATFTNMLGTMSHLIEKAEQSGKGDLLDLRLAPDMFPLATQVRMVTFQVLNTLNRLTGTSHAIGDSDPTDLAEAKANVASAQEAVNATSPDAFVAADAPVEFDIPNGMEFALTAEEYVRDWALAQLYFHATTFYAILRANGVELGKADFVGFMMHHIKR